MSIREGFDKNFANFEVFFAPLNAARREASFSTVICGQPPNTRWGRAPELPPAIYDWQHPSGRGAVPRSCDPVVHASGAASGVARGVGVELVRELGRGRRGQAGLRFRVKR